MILNISLINNSYYYKQVGFKANVKPKTDYSGLYEKMQKLEIKAIEEQEIIPPAKNIAKQVKEKVTKPKSSEDANNTLRNYISKEGTMYGMLSGDIRIERNKTFTIYGQMHGDIQVEKDAMLKNYGTVHGDINNNGNVVNYGIIKGIISGNGLFQNYGINNSCISKN